MPSDAVSLLRELDSLEATMATWQVRGAVERYVTTDTRQDYLEWYGEALCLVPEDLKPKFRDAYEGGGWTARIRAYLDSPLAPNVLYNPEQPAPGLSRWQYPFDTTCRANISTQRGILHEVAASHSHPRGDGPSSVLDDLAENLARFPEVLTLLEKRVGHKPIRTERDLQPVLHALLSLLFSDVRAEAFVSEFAGSNTRVDFLIVDTGIAFEAKMARASLSRASLGDELLADWIRYQHHPECKGIFAFIYDPRHLLTNSVGLERDLKHARQGIPTRAIVVR